MFWNMRVKERMEVHLNLVVEVLLGLELLGGFAIQVGLKRICAFIVNKSYLMPFLDPYIKCLLVSHRLGTQPFDIDIYHSSVLPGEVYINSLSMSRIKRPEAGNLVFISKCWAVAFQT